MAQHDVADLVRQELASGLRVRAELPFGETDVVAGGEGPCTDRRTRTVSFVNVPSRWRTRITCVVTSNGRTAPSRR